MKINKYFQNHHTYNKSWNELSVYQIWIISKPLVICDNFMSLYNFFSWSLRDTELHQMQVIAII